MENPELGDAPDAGSLRVLPREELEAVVRRRTSELQDIVDAMADVMVTLDTEGRIETANEAVSDVLGYEPSTVEGRPVEFLFAAEESADGRAVSGPEFVERLVTGDAVTDLAVPFETADGREVPMQVSTSVMRDGDAVTGFVCVATDVTERKERERALRESRERYRTLFETNQIVLWEFDLSTARERAEAVAEETDDLAAYLAEHPGEHLRVLDGVAVTDVNEKAVEFYGADSKRHLKEKHNQVFTSKALDSWRDLWGRIVEGETTFRTECTTQTFDGEKRAVLAELNVPAGQEDDYSRVYLTALDITERKEREEELERRNQYLDEFASVVSHDIASPLGTIENKARLVEMTGDPSHASDIYDATERIQRLIDDLLELARQGKRVGETEPVEFETAVRRAWRSVNDTGATLAVESTGRFEASPERLRQLLENLLSNAVDHGATDGEVHVRAATHADGFYVADDGPGIDPDERPKVFEQGYTTADEGAGLGLAIVDRIVDAHDWSVEIGDSDEGGARMEVSGVTMDDVE
ncbi:hypothetical protein BRC92_01800 [Halobacteriales archaeon QS_4_69_31]|nr:MAG: hypothetical protein BRC92_01800 [Halobacteriales archaeon QS_4_69_31]